MRSKNPSDSGASSRRTSTTSGTPCGGSGYASATWKTSPTRSSSSCTAASARTTPPAPSGPWLFAFAIRAAADYRRLARHRVELREDASSLVDPGPTPQEQAITRERLDLVALALEALDFDRRAVFVLHEIDGVPVNEAASVLGIPVNTAHSRLRLARADFARAVHRLQSRRGGAR